jgi:hypothetical protein
LIYLPGYCPGLNPGESAWKNVSLDRIGKTGVTGKQDLKSTGTGALLRPQKRPRAGPRLLLRSASALYHRRTEPVRLLTHALVGPGQLASALSCVGEPGQLT